jgi:competence protein CoiA
VRLRRLLIPLSVDALALSPVNRQLECWDGCEARRPEAMIRGKRYGEGMGVIALDSNACRRLHAPTRGWMATTAIVDGQPAAPTPHARGSCLGCGAAMVAKTGRVTSHWAHAAPRDWDPWWENETAWHREWKAKFPEDWREIRHEAQGGEIHRADVRTGPGLILEFQHSSLRDDELAAREAFYDNLVWVLDGRPFAANFEIHHILPDPDAPIAQDMVWVPAKVGLYGTHGGLYHLRSEFEAQVGRAAARSEVRYGTIRGLGRIKRDIEAAYRGHHQFVWKQPRGGWLTAGAPVFIDFGEAGLWRLGVYDDSGLRCCRFTSQGRFVDAARVARDAAELERLLWPVRPFEDFAGYPIN